MNRKAVLLSVFILMASVLRGNSTSAEAAPQQQPHQFTKTSISPGNYVGWDGRMNLPKGRTGEFNLTNWRVDLSDAQGPIFRPIESPLLLPTFENGTWADLPGSLFTEIGSSSVSAMVFDADGNLIIGGQFANAGGNLSADNLVMWDGTTWHDFGYRGANTDLGNVSSYVNDLGFLNNGDLVVVGAFQ
ncbi:MAG: hypothetical protein N2D54_05760, partial [Chloroflexota bacterium]